MKIFWFCRTGSSDSFSRVSKNVFPELDNMELYTSVNPLNLKEFDASLFKDYIVMGSPIQLDPHTVLTFNEFCKGVNNLGQMMKFSILQAVYYCYHNRVDRLIIMMGNYEVNWLMRNIKHIKEHSAYLLKYTKIVIYSPFDHIPSKDAIEYYSYADTVMTTVPIESELTKEYKIVGHANDPCFKRYPSNARNTMIDVLNKSLLTEINYDDMIILNANFYSDRKRIEATVDGFCEFVKQRGKKYKLWLHNGGKLPKNIDKIPKDQLITTNPCSSQQLNMIYNVCQFGLQTSWGEGWSLTNCEHAVCGGIQIVPDFLATGYHFKENRGILMNVSQVSRLNEDSKEIVVGITDIEEIVRCLTRATAMSCEEKEEMYTNFMNYFKYAWKTEVKKLVEFL